MEEFYKPIVKKDNENEEAEFVFNFLDNTVLQLKEWKNMPEFICEDLEPFKQVLVSFKNREAMNEFAKLVGQKITFETPSIWYPKVTIEEVKNKRYVDENEEW